MRYFDGGALYEIPYNSAYNALLHVTQIIEDKKYSKRPKVYEDAELEALLGQDSCQTQEEQYDGQYF